MLNSQHLAIFMFLIFLPKVMSRKCYSCVSTHSFGDCDAKRTSGTCLFSNHCVKVKVSSTATGVEAFAKGCAKTCSASSVPQCRLPGIKCEVTCCSSDYCNGGSDPSVMPRKCYSCVSTHSFGDCDAKRTSGTCLGSNHCSKVKVYNTATGVEAFAKGCAKTCSASSIPQCRSPGIKCDVTCCSSDYCNGGSDPSVTSRKCYSCVSTHSFGDCDAKRTSGTCLSSNHCVKVKVSSTATGVEAFAKGCAKTCSASSVPECRLPGIKCDVTCCSSDYCNGGSGPSGTYNDERSSVNTLIGQRVQVLLIATVITASSMYLKG